MRRGNRLLTPDWVPYVDSWAETATYQEPESPLYQGNPLIEALPKSRSTAGMINLLKHYPKFDRAHQAYSEEIQPDMIENMSQVFQVLNELLTMERPFAPTIQRGYIGHDLFDIPTVEKTAQKIQADQPQNRERTPARRFYIIGMSGMGKTTSIETILKLYPEVIWHNEYNVRTILRAQVTWLKLEYPHNGSTRSLCFAFFATLDRILGVNYYTTHAENSWATVAKMQISMAFLCELLNIGILIIDEVQHLNRTKSGGVEAMLNFFVDLSNTIHIPVMLIGPYHPFDVFAKEFLQARRGTRQGNFIWQCRQRDDHSWKTLLKGIWTYQYVRQFVPLTFELSEALYYVTQGVTDLVITAFILAQEWAITDGMETIQLSTIYPVAADSTEFTYKPLQDLRTKTVSLQEYVNMVMPIDFQDAYVCPVRKLGSTRLASFISSKAQPSSRVFRSPQPNQTELAPHRVSSAQALRQHLPLTDIETMLHETLKEARYIAQAGDYIPAGDGPC